MPYNFNTAPVPPYNLSALQQQINALSQQAQAMQQMSQPQQMPQVQLSGSHIQYVNGAESANAYNMQPNSSALLMDSNKARFYVKTSDASGFCTVKAFDFSEAKEESQATSEYVTKAEFDSLRTKIEGYEQMFNGSQKPAQIEPQSDSGHAQKGGNK